MKCTKCGAEIPEGYSTCPGCNEPAASSEGGETKKKSVLPKVAVGVGVAAVAGAIGFTFMNRKPKDPKEVVIAAFENIYSDKDQKPLEELFGASKLLELYETGDVQEGLTLKLSGLSEEGIEQFLGSGLRIDSLNDRTNDKYALNLEAIYNNADLCGFNLYYGDDKLKATIPDLTNRVFVVDFSTDLAAQLSASPIVGPMLEQSGISGAAVAAYASEIRKMAADQDAQTEKMREVMDRYEKGCSAQKDFKEALTVTAGEEKTFTVNGKEQKCKGYDTVVTKDSVIEFLDTTSDFFLQDDGLRQTMVDQMEMTVRLQELVGETTGLTSGDLVNQTYDDAEKQIEDLLDQLDSVMEDINMTVYVSSDGRLAAIEGTTAFHDPDDQENKVDTEFQLELQGGAFRTQNIDANVELKSEDQVISIALTREGTYDGKELTDSWELSIEPDESMNEDRIALNYSASYNQEEDGAFEMKLEPYEGDTALVTFSLSGKVDELEKGKRIHATIDELLVKVNDMPEEYLTLDGEYGISPLEEALAEPEGPETDVLAATEDDWDQIADEMSMKLLGILLKVLN